MKKIKCINLDDLAQGANIINGVLQRTFIGGATSTNNNPHPRAEYDAYIGGNLWSMGSGYVVPGGDGDTDDKPTEGSYGYEPHYMDPDFSGGGIGGGMDGVGLTQSYSYFGSVTIKDGKIYVLAFAQDYRADLNPSYGGSITVFDENGNVISTTLLTKSSSGYFTGMNIENSTPIGDATVSLPTSGKYSVQISTSSAIDSGYGHSYASGSQTIFKNY